MYFEFINFSIVIQLEHRNLRLEDGYEILLKNYSIYKENKISKLNEKLPLSILLCLLADGRQLTLDEIDRILVYFLEQKAKMFALAPGTLPPLPSHYANLNKKDFQQPNSTSTSNDSSVMVEQIRQILMKSSTVNNSNQHLEKEKSGQESQLNYSSSNHHLCSSLPNSAAADAAAAIFQAYSLFNQRNN